MAKRPANRMKKRIAIFTVVFTILLSALTVRVGWIQFVDGKEYQGMAIKQQTSGRVIPAKRGTIYDRNGNSLAISIDVDLVAINPKTIKDYAVEEKMDVAQYQAFVANALSEMLELAPEGVLKKVQSAQRYVEIKDRVSKEVGDQVRKWRNENKVPGIYVDEDSMRYYPNDNLAAHVIGFTGKDNQGLVTGVEFSFDNELTGKPGTILANVDGKGNELPFAEERRIEPENGNNLVLTIDETIQYLVEKELNQAVADAKVSQGAAAIVMQPSTGDILAMASVPDFDLNQPFAAPVGIDPATWKGNTAEDINKLSQTVWRNKALSDTYEPGSTFKTITSAALLEEGLVKRDTIVQDVPLVFPGTKPINCWRRAGHGTETFEQAVYNSCNPVFARLSQDLGIETFYNYVRAFGFYDKTGIELVGEANSIFHKQPTNIDMAVASFGQRFQITPIQLISAYSAIGNGGTLLKPRIVKQITDDNGNVVETFEPEVVRNVVSEKTAAEVADILEGVVSIGTGKNAYVAGYRVAGKTGTSETIQTDTTGRYIVSMCALAPADEPEIALLFVLDHPNVTPANLNSGGFLAAPPAGKLIEEIMSYLQVERRYTELDKVEQDDKAFVPYAQGKTLKSIKDQLKKDGLKYKIVGEDSDSAIIVNQMPTPGTVIPKGSNVILYTSDAEPAKKSKVPDLKGMNISQAFNALYKENLSIKVYGKGKALTQSIEAGKEVEWGTVIEVDFREFDVD